mmetsp:Transcript_24854/g.52281  ORF Transcript_24854/g.52281 Transcript_24854/m.52281 type:complete len:521 (-) Transcript_24854:11-1573(-)|eukprot:CAMPEP_0171372202 /NCGR_PEP_ID=MMETSP0879-20121228/9121_1 /TAXON_ID=67004 /ORGANISM="Thalassiosira weissflogii, Strain CCMP1336" /LENGTH=520 /DNA_ID=CAMNT_0011880901 /DNA_START=52 /DNA_END=1614 /DNA_ORIENTATION=-
MSLSNPSTSRPGAMSLLDKYAAINASIEDARKRVASTRADLESIKSEIENVREEREGMIEETQSTNEKKARLEVNLKEAVIERIAKLNEKARIEKEFNSVKRELSETRHRVDEERMKFLERGREFRASCKRMRVAASILVLNQQLNSNGGNFENVEKYSEIDLWRRLQQELESFSDEDLDDDGIDSNITGRRQKPSNERGVQKPDPEMEFAENEEKRSRQALIEAECELHAMSNEHNEAVNKCNDRNQKLTQQRAQLDRHRKEMEKMKKELEQLKNETAEVNQSAMALEREFNTRKQHSDMSHGNHLRSSHQCNYHSNLPFNSSMYGCTPYRPELNSMNNVGCRSSGHKVNGLISNPYKINRSRNRNNNQQNKMPPHQEIEGEPLPQSIQKVGATPRHQYASDMVNSLSTPQNTYRDEKMQATQHPHHGGRIRRYRKFGTAVSVNSALNAFGISSDRNDIATPCALCDSRKVRSQVIMAEGGSVVEGENGSDASSSSSSSDDEIISFEVFGKKRNVEIDE